MKHILILTMAIPMAVMLFVATDERTASYPQFEVSSTGAITANELLLAGNESYEPPIEEPAWGGMVQHADLRFFEDPGQLQDGTFLRKEPSSFIGSPDEGAPFWINPEERVIDI